MDSHHYTSSCTLLRSTTSHRLLLIIDEADSLSCASWWVAFSQWTEYKHVLELLILLKIRKQWLIIALNKRFYNLSSLIYNNVFRRNFVFFFEKKNASILTERVLKTIMNIEKWLPWYHLGEILKCVRKHCWYLKSCIYREK